MVKNADLSTFTSVGSIHVTLLKFNGLLILEGYQGLSYALVLFAHCSHALITSMYICGVVRNLRSGSGDVEILAECIGLCGVHLRFLIMFVRKKKIAAILAEARKLWAEISVDEQGVIRSFVERSVRITHCYLVSTVAMAVFYLTVSQLPIGPIQPNATFERSLPYIFYTDVAATSTWYEPALVAQMTSMLNICFSCSGVDTAAPFFVMLACGHLRSLCGRLRGLDAEIGEQRIDGTERIVECIVYHQKIIRFCKDVEKLTGLLFMMQLLSTTYNMSLIGLKLVGNDPDKFKYVTVLLLLMIQLFLCQWAPDVLVTESEFLTNSAYFVPLSGLDDKKMAKLIYILMMRSQRSIQLRAGGFVNLSMECFGSMIKSAMSFFTVLRSIN